MNKAIKIVKEPNEESVVRNFRITALAVSEEYSATTEEFSAVQ